MRLKLRTIEACLASLSGLLLVLSFPWFDLSGLAWIALVPLLLALEGKGKAWAFALSYLTGCVFFTGIFYWVWVVPEFTIIDFVLLAWGDPTVQPL